MISEWKLPTQLTLRITNLVNELGDFITDKRDEFDNRSVKWQESDQGQAVETWLEELEEVVEALEAAPEFPE